MFIVCREGTGLLHCGSHRRKVHTNERHIKPEASPSKFHLSLSGSCPRSHMCRRSPIQNDGVPFAASSLEMPNDIYIEQRLLKALRG